MKKIRMGVIGVGGISGSHIDGILHSPDAELVAICDINEEVLAKKGDYYKIPETHRFNNHIDLLECPDVDAVSICVPNNCHLEIASNAIKYRKAFALEKPITLNFEEASKLKELADAANLPHMVCFSYRFKSAVRYARHLIQSGQLGRIYHVYAQYLQGWAINDDAPLVWRFSKKISGSGALGDLGSHALDLVAFLTGDYVKVCGHAGTFTTSRKKLNSEETGTVDVDDFCHYMAEIEGGIAATFNITRNAFHRGNYQRVEVYGDKGGLVYMLDEKNDGADTIEVRFTDTNGDVKGYQPVPVPEEFKANQMQSFFDVINGKGDGLAATIEDGYKNQLLLDAIIESFENEKWVYVKDNK